MKELVNKIYRAYQRKQKIKVIKRIWVESVKRAYDITNNSTFSKKMKQRGVDILLRHAYIQIHLIKIQPYKKFFTKTGGGCNSKYKRP